MKYQIGAASAAVAMAMPKPAEVTVTEREAWSELKRRRVGVGYMRARKAWNACLIVDLGDSKPLCVEGDGIEAHLAIGNALAKVGEVFEAEWMNRQCPN